MLIIAACSFAACKTAPAYDKVAQLAIDEDLIKIYIDSVNATGIEANKITATRTSDGMYYQIYDAGKGSAVYDPTDVIKIRYTGSTIKQQLYDMTPIVTDDLLPTFSFSSAIEGWQKGLRLIQPGGHIRLIIPSTMAYQNRIVPAAQQTNRLPSFLPANSILDFDIQLIEVKKFVPIVQTN
ncbi:FKBP-type peptidyl-prolyl cis-trans isomerase [Pedobacter cryoconitis]|uniref:FKBP-type peptidyl-prolyl cis-trans isomerase n=1 Tax=Pedobacter cryoconitis TaxID=188932 RepID=UPI00147425CF|nr:FKBP-type peptidyl-prolyl cis-trans isomerase [Pedobacter cryoconitis]